MWPDVRADVQPDLSLLNLDFGEAVQYKSRVHPFGAPWNGYDKSGREVGTLTLFIHG